MRSPRGNYYGNAITERDGRRYVREVARQARTFDAAADAIDATGLPGYVQLWSEREQRRTVVAQRDASGQWTTTNPLTGVTTTLPRTSANA